MPSSSTTVASLVLAIGLALAAADVYVATARSLIGVSLDDVVAAKELRHEKHPGVDDVHLITLSDGRMLQFDARLAEQIDVGDHLRKSVGDWTLRSGDSEIPLSLSDDARGMLPTMGVAAALLIGLALIAIRRS